MLHDDQVTSAPKATRVSIRTAVWMVMWRHPAMRAPLRGCEAPNSSLNAIKPGISASASRISFLPYSAKERSLTLYLIYFRDVISDIIVDLYCFLLKDILQI